jgi:hypothetical protein
LSNRASAEFCGKLRTQTACCAADDLRALLSSKTCRNFTRKWRRCGSSNRAASPSCRSCSACPACGHLDDALNGRLGFSDTGTREECFERLRRLLNVRSKCTIRKVDKRSDWELTERHRPGAKFGPLNRPRNNPEWPCRETADDAS